MLTAALAVSANNHETAAAHREGMGPVQKPVTTPWSQPDTQSRCPKHTQENRGIPAKSLQADLSKVAGQGLLCKLQHASALLEGAACAFQTLLALILNLSYKEERLVATLQDLL